MNQVRIGHPDKLQQSSCHQIFTDLAKVLLKAGEPQQALELIDQLAEESEQIRSFIELAILQHRLGSPKQSELFMDKAMQILQSVQDTEQYKTLLDDAFFRLTSSEKVDFALKLIKRNPQHQFQLYTLIRVAEELLEQAQTGNAFELLPRIKNVIQQSKDTKTKLKQLRMAADYANSINESQIALDFLAETLPLIDRLGNVQERLSDQFTLALSFAAAGDSDQAIEMLPQLKSTWFKLKVMYAVSETLLKQGKHDQLESLVNETWKLYLKHQTSHHHPSPDFDSQIAVILIRGGKIGKGLELLRQIEPNRSISNSNDVVLTLRSPLRAERPTLDESLSGIACELAQSGYIDQAHELLSHITEPESRALGLIEIAKRLAEEKDHSSAVDVLEDASKFAESIAEAKPQSKAFCEISRIYSVLEDHNNLNDVLQHALKLAHESDDPNGKTSALFQIASAYLDLAKETAGSCYFVTDIAGHRGS